MLTDPSAYLDSAGFLIRDHSIKHYSYEDLKNCTLEMLENQCQIIVD
jgi:hypothetical protein